MPEEGTPEDVAARDEDTKVLKKRITVLKHAMLIHLTRCMRFSAGAMPTGGTCTNFYRDLTEDQKAYRIKAGTQAATLVYKLMNARPEQRVGPLLTPKEEDLLGQGFDDDEIARITEMSVGEVLAEKAGKTQPQRGRT
jgi:hypothetical protein